MAYSKIKKSIRKSNFCSYRRIWLSNVMQVPKLEKIIIKVGAAVG